MHWSLLSQLNPLGVFVFVVYFHLISYHDVSGLSNSHVWFHFCGSRTQLSYFGATHKAGSGGLIWKLDWGKITFKLTQVIVRMLFLMGGWTKGPPQSAGCCQRPLSVPCHTGLSNKSIYLSQPWRPRRQIQSAYKTEVAISCNPVISMTSHHLSHCSIDQEWVTKVQTTQDGAVGGGVGWLQEDVGVIRVHFRSYLPQGRWVGKEWVWANSHLCISYRSLEELWSPVTRSQVQGLVPRPRKRNPEPRAPLKLTEPLCRKPPNHHQQAFCP